MGKMGELGELGEMGEMGEMGDNVMEMWRGGKVERQVNTVQKE